MLTRRQVAAGVSVLAMAVGAAVSKAAPYASGIQVSGTTVNFVLNETADSVAYSVNGGPVQFLADTTKGAKSFTLSSPTDKFTIVARKSDTTGYSILTGATVATSANGLSQGTAAGGFNLISNDANPLDRYNSPRGVDVGKNPNNPNFGTAYISNSAAGSVTAGLNNVPNGAGRAAIGDGLYALKADQTDAFGYGDTAKNPNGVFDSVSPPSASSPFRVTAANDGNLYVADFSDTNGNAYRSNADLTSGTAVFNTVGGPSTLPPGQNHGSTTAVYVEGSSAAGNLKVYTLDEDATQTQYGGAGTADKNNLWRYDINGSALPFGDNPTRINAGSYLLTAATSDLDRGKDGKWYLAQTRTAGNENGVVVLDSAGNKIYDTLTASRTLLNDQAAPDIIRQVQGMAVSPDQKWIAVILNNSDVAVIPLVNGIPDLANRRVVDTGTDINSGRDIAFDAADNIHYVSSGQAVYRVLSPGGNTSYTTTFDGTSYAFRASSSLSLTAAPTLGSGGTVVINGTNGNYTLASVATPGTAVTTASFALNDIGSEPGTLLALLDLSGTGDLASVVTELQASLPGATVTANPATPGWAAPFGGQWDLLVSLANPTSAGGNDFLNLDLSTSGFTIDRVAAIPEPATLGLAFGGAVALLAVRRRRRSV